MPSSEDSVSRSNDGARPKDGGSNNSGSAADGRSRRWEDHKHQRREAILQTAVAMLRRTGDLGGVKDIADEAGLPRSVVYRLFKDRQDLDEQIRIHIVEDLQAALSPTLEPSGTISGAIKAGVSTYVEWIVENPQLHLFLGAGSSRHRTIGSPVVTGTKTAIAMQVAELISAQLDSRGADPRFAEPLAFAMTGMIDSTVNRWLNRSFEPIDAGELSSFLASLAWQMVSTTVADLGLDLGPDTRLVASS